MLKISTLTTFSKSCTGATGVALLGEDVYTSGYYTYSDIKTVALWKNNSLVPIGIRNNIRKPWYNHFGIRK